MVHIKILHIRFMHASSFYDLLFSKLVLIKYLFFQGHASFITHIDWSADGQYIRSNSGDYELLYCK